MLVFGTMNVVLEKVMRECTKNLIRKYALMKLKYDFMGYTFDHVDDLSFHHLLVPRRISPSLGLNRGYSEWNGVILVQKTSHEYLHVVERFDLDRFYAITSEMLDEKIKGSISLENIKAIDDVLYSFEKEYCGKTYAGSGNEIVKPIYTKRLIKKSI